MLKPDAGHLRPTLIALAALLCSGCASTATRSPADPLEPGNRGVYKFNDALDRAVLKPTAKAYDKTTPGWLKTGIGNFFTNLSYPFTIVNQLLQGKPRQAGQDTARFLINTTLGWGGVLDVASGARLPHHDEDLGQTLGVWGMPPGPYLMVPFLGPSSVRDLPSRVVDSVFTPLSWGDRSTFYWVAQGIDVIDTRARLLPLDSALSRVYDKYGFIRDAYLQQRNYAVHDGNVPEEPPLDEELEDPDPAADDAAQAGDAAAVDGSSDEPAAGDAPVQPPAPTPLTDR